MTEKVSDVECGLRRRLLGCFLLGSVGVLAELLLLGHREGLVQQIPLWTLGFGLAVGLWTLRGGGRGRLRCFEILSMVYLAAGVTGLVKHYQSNLEFELEMEPGLQGLALVRQALTGATPVLAPGAVLFLGLLGLLFVHRHPKLSGESS